MDKLYIIIPAYNEEETIQAVISDWYPVVERVGMESRLIIINDGSLDKTYEIICKEAENRPQLLPLTKSNGGHGAAVLYGYKYAIKHYCAGHGDGGWYIFQTDADGQTVSEEFWSFWEKRQDYKMIIGYRNKRQDGFSRIIVTKVLKLLIKLCFGVSVKDANTPFRLMEANTLGIQLEAVPNNFNLPNVMISVLYVKRELSIKWIPVTFRPRQGGVNSINMKRICRIGKQAVKDFIVLNKCI